MSFVFEEIVASISHIRGGLPAGRLSKRLRYGEHKSIFFGPSFNLHTIRPYDPERDPPNQIIQFSTIFDPFDEDTIYARQCIEDHEIKVVMLVDLSSSMCAGVDFRKARMTLETLGYIGMTAARDQDPVGLIGFTDNVVVHEPPRYGENSLHYLLSEVFTVFKNNMEQNAVGKLEAKQTNFIAALQYLNNVYDKSCFVVVMSDFVSYEGIASLPVFRTVADRHEVVCIFMDDPSEFAVKSKLGYVSMTDIERGKVNIVPKRKLVKIEKEMRQKRRELRREFRKQGVDSIVLEYGKQFRRLVRFFNARKEWIRA